MTNIQIVCVLHVLIAGTVNLFTTQAACASNCHPPQQGNRHEGKPVDIYDLPYQVQESLLDVSDDIGDRQMTGPIRKIYRKDLDPNYIAYYELEFQELYFIFSAGPKTGDHKLVQEGKIPRVTDLLIKQASDFNGTCSKFFRLTPDGVTICEDSNGDYIASTIDLETLTTHVRFTSLNQEVRTKLLEFKEQWHAVSREVRSSLEWRSTSNDTEKTTSRDKLSVSRVLTIGDSQMLPIGSSNPSDVEITLHYEGRGTSRSEFNKKVWQARLCAVLGHICIDNSTKVNISMGLSKRMDLYFILFKVKDDYNFVAAYLQNKDLDFVFELKSRERTIAVRHYTIRLTQKRVRRSSWNSWTESRIPFENLMPDYDQHKCCGGCWSGCTPVAWAQIFAYYDRVAHTYGFRYSINHWKGIIAPGYLNDQVKKYVEALRTPLGTFCNNGGGGSTYASSSMKLSSWFNQRQGSGSIMKVTTKYFVVSYVKRGFPVMTNIWWKGGGHSVVVTKIKERSRQFKVCRKVGWLFWRSTKCEWKYESQCEWYRRMGWGGKSNAWYPASFTSAFVAIP